MCPGHLRWEEFVGRLEGGEGCNFKVVKGKTTWKCKGGENKDRATAILKKMSKQEPIDIEGTLRFFESRGGYCDCEILFNVDVPMLKEFHKPSNIHIV